jgi:hypothetical protein
MTCPNGRENGRPNVAVAITFNYIVSVVQEFAEFISIRVAAMKPFRILSLAGGGARGLFQSHYLHRLSQHGDPTLSKRFDLVAGTSVGSINGLTVSLEIPTAKAVKLFNETLPTLFTPKRWAQRDGRPLEEERNLHLKDLGNMLQAAGADAIGALLVFLNLLECQAEGVGNIGLTHVEHEPAHAQAAADVLVRWIKSSPGHLCFLAVAAIFSGYPGPVLQVPGAV